MPKTKKFSLRKKQKKFHLLMFSVAFAGIGFYLLFRTLAATVAPTGTYTDWHWPTNSQGYNSFEWNVTPETTSTTNGYFYSHSFYLINGDGGYFGIQTMGSIPTGKIAIFSLWNALDAQSPQYAGTFGGEGVGFTVRISYPWIVNRTYRLRVNYVSTDSSGSWWGAWIKDTVTGVESYVGQIKVPPAWGKLQNESINWTEHYAGPLNSCSDIQFSSVVFSNPTANGGAIMPTSHTNHLANPVDCPGSYVIDADNAHGTRQQMGASTPPADTVPPLVSFNFTGFSTQPADNAVVTDKRTVSMQIVSNDGSGIASTVASINGLPATLTNNTVTTPNTNGNYAMNVEVKDNANNTTTKTQTILIRHRDFSRNGVVDLIDLSMLMQKWGQTSTIFDFDDTATTQLVDLYDLSFLMQSWGSTQ